MWDYQLGWEDFPEHKPKHQGWCATTDGGNIALNWWDGEKFSHPEHGDCCSAEVVAFNQVTSNVTDETQETRKGL
jgi:hypothetical protein